LFHIRSLLFHIRTISFHTRSLSFHIRSLSCDPAGHNYGGKTTTIGAERRSGLLRKITESEWRTMHRAVM
jgi:hypothetical protein